MHVPTTTEEYGERSDDEVGRTGIRGKRPPARRGEYPEVGPARYVDTGDVRVYVHSTSVSVTTAMGVTISNGARCDEIVVTTEKEVRAGDSKWVSGTAAALKNGAGSYAVHGVRW